MASRIPPERLAEVEQRLLRAEAPADFVPVLAKAWSRTKRQIWKYVAIVRKRLAERSKGLDPEADREMIRAFLLNAYRSAEVGSPERGPDAKGMVQAARTLGELTQVLGTRRVEITGAGGGPVGVEAVAKVVLLPPLESDDARGAVAAEPGSPGSVPREPR